MSSSLQWLSGQGYNEGYAEEAYVEEAYADEGYAEEAYTEEGYAEEAYAEERYAKEGYDGYAEEGYDEEGYAKEGYDEGYAEEGYDGIPWATILLSKALLAFWRNSEGQFWMCDLRHTRRRLLLWIQLLWGALPLPFELQARPRVGSWLGFCIGSVRHPRRATCWGKALAKRKASHEPKALSVTDNGTNECSVHSSVGKCWIIHPRTLAGSSQQLPMMQT